MSDDRKLEVIDPNGWRKEYPLEKTVIFIGSDPTSDIQLKVDPGAGIAARHLQLIAVPDVGYRLVNLGESGVLVGAAGDREITPRASAELTEGEQIKIGEFILILRGEIWSSGGAAGPTSRSKNIGLSLTLPKSELAPHETMEGIITVFNLGDFSGAQFDLDLEGLETDCFELEPGPLLSSGADKEAMFRLYHLGHKPLAGDVNLTIRVVAPKAYPAEQISVARRIRVLPYYSYQLALLTPGAVKPAAPIPSAKQKAPKAPATVVRTPAKPTPARSSQPTPSPSPETADWWSAELPVKAAVAATAISEAEAASSALTETAIPPAPAAEPTVTAEAEPAPLVEEAEAEPPESEAAITPAAVAVGAAITPEPEPMPLAEQAEGWRRIFRFLTFWRRQPAAAPADSLTAESAPVELPPQPETQLELEGEPAPSLPVEPPGEQPYFVEPAPAEPFNIAAERVEAEPVSPPQPEPKPLPPEAEPTPPPSPRELAMATSPPPVEGDGLWSPTRQPEPITADKTLWSAGAAAATTASEPPLPAQVEPESAPAPPPGEENLPPALQGKKVLKIGAPPAQVKPESTSPPLPDEDNLPPSLQGKKVLKISASQSPPVEPETPAEPVTNLWSTGAVEPADESTKKTETDNQE